MDSYKRGFVFLQQAWGLARRNPSLLKPALYALLAGLGLAAAGVGLVLVDLLVSGGSWAGQALAAFTGVLLLFALLACPAAFAGEMARLAHSRLTPGVPPAWETPVGLRGRWRDWLRLAVIEEAAMAARWLPGRSLGSLFREPWSVAPELVLPAMANEGLSVKEALPRGSDLVRRNLVMIAPGLVGVRPVTGLLGLILVLIGVGLGYVVGQAVTGSLGWAAGIAAGGFVASLTVLKAAILASIGRTLYSTCLYGWALEEEQRRAEASTSPALPPAPLAAALKDLSGLLAPIYSE